MFRYFRRSIKPILWIVIIGFVGSIFLVWGMQYSPQSRPPPRVARVNGEELSWDRFERLEEGYIGFYRSVLKENFNESILESIHQRILEDLIRERILLDEAERIGIRVKDEEIVEEIRRPFLDKDGTLDTKRFNEYIDRMSERLPNFLSLREEEVRTDLTIQRLLDIIRDTVRVTDLELRKYYYKVTREPNEKDFEANKEELIKALLNEKYQRVYEDWYNSLRKRARIELNPAFETKGEGSRDEG